jgi:3-oxoacyl-[acyl-carrier-protein] synthase II
MDRVRRKVVITGCGAVSPLGSGNAPLIDGLLAGRTGVRRFHTFPVDPAIAPHSAEVIDFDPKKFIRNRKSIKVMARDIQLAVGAAEVALEHARLKPAEVNRTRFGVNCGAGLIATELEELGSPVEAAIGGDGKLDLKKWGEAGISKMPPLWMLKYLPNMPACHVSIIHDLQGPNNSITAGESSALLAIGEAARLIERNNADIFLAGGADSRIHPLSITRLSLLNRLGTGHPEDPDAASRPFDAARDGIVPGEGAAFLVLESPDHAKARGASILGEVIGFGSCCHPGDRGYAVGRSMSRALTDAKVAPAELGFVCSGAAGGVAEDRDEARGIAEALGTAAGSVPVVAFKSQLGHSFAGSGAIELAACLLAADKGTLPGTRNFTGLEAGMPALRVLADSIPFPNRPFLIYSGSHSGQAGALVIRPRVD